MRKKILGVIEIVHRMTGFFVEEEPIKPRCPFLPPTLTGMTVEEILKIRVMRRYESKRSKFPDLPELTFEELFDLPEWLSLNEWITINLRGRGVDFMSKCNTDHIVPLNWAKTTEEYIALFSHKNTRFLDPSMNEKKSDYMDEENRELCLSLLGRYPSGRRTKEETTVRPNPVSDDRLERLLARGQKQHRKSFKNKKKRSF